MTADEFVTAVSPLIGEQGARYYFTPTTLGRGAEFGLDLGQWYAVGRGGVLGSVPASVVRAAFGYFNPAFIDRVWTSATDKIDPLTAAREHFLCAALCGREYLSEVPGLETFAANADKVLAAADADGLALFAGFATLSLVDDLPGRVLQQIVVLREYRGSAHLAALRCVGLASKTAHFAKRPEAGRMFGYAADDVPTITEGDRRALVEAEALTDRAIRSAWEAIDAADRDQFVETLSDIKAAFG